MSSDSESMQTPLASRKAVKMEPQVGRTKSLNIAKILGRMKQSANYSGYSTNSSFNKDSISTDFLKIDDDLFPEDKEEEARIEENIREKRREITEKARLSPKRTTREPSEVNELTEQSKPDDVPTTPIPVKTAPKKRGRPRKTDLNTTSNTKKPRQATSKATKATEVTKVTKAKTTKKPLKKKQTTEVSKKPKPKAKAKKQEDESSSFSLFEALDIGEKSDNDKDKEEVFILESPVKKKKRNTSATTRKTSRKKIKNEKKEKLGSDPFNEYDAYDYQAVPSDDEVKAVKVIDNKRRIEELRLEAEEEKQKLKKQREDAKKKLEHEIAATKAIELKEQLKREKREKRLQKLEKFKESVSKAIGHEETIIVPLRDEADVDDGDRDASTNKINLRRASLASRGKRLSSIGNGFIGTPHSEIPDEELHKHMDIDLPDSYKLRNLIIWIGKRLIKDGNDEWIDNVLDKFENDGEIKHQLKNVSKTVLNQLLEDLSHGKVKVDWWGDQINSGSQILSSTDQPIMMKRNKENLENAKNLELYKEEIRKLQREANIWNSISENEHISETDKTMTKLKQLKIPPQEFTTDEDREMQNIVRVAYMRARKLERLLKRYNAIRELTDKVTFKRTRRIVEQMKKESEVDALTLLRKLSKLH
ncbi:hypothetical protein CANINC_004976 [Pichia inconspicua]|uniref:Uncharacterized protein n=1 Tax=Pichia inconspicua TaxID=52247 RepID=A0A4T0WV51_9ASCO|nr:hypothetical protein CANINC_004976 [[Candida] inconspicua]